MYGCEWDNETGEVKGYDQFGYDGEDFIALDQEGESWIAPKPQAFNTKHNWENNRVAQKLEKIYLTQTCVEWLMMYVRYGSSSLMKTDLPSVSLLQRNGSSAVCCHATGFYPNRAEMFWRKDGKEIHDGLAKGEILPNNDGTFQMSIYVNLSFVPSPDWAKYECVFQFSGFKENIVTRLERRNIRTNEVNLTTSLIAAAAVVLMILVLVIAVIVILCPIKNNVTQYITPETSPFQANSSSDTQSKFDHFTHRCCCCGSKTTISCFRWRPEF
ncbi:class I histocompatibility antigen, Gogo-C*0203 alpha chain-like [Poeciliopsis prolifica]|uniref:class I histocompatibility antigen, Gogo-C*0203 alpha chain-like n=1 Tax=Poeciliopsis prolifica TaxID=188132 RepID=UPI00241354FF|nr:class I histocompatibility antigen, Gogo-C*0203 alpha chain-like [Poeciliopsis prolifica]